MKKMKTKIMKVFGERRLVFENQTPQPHSLDEYSPEKAQAAIGKKEGGLDTFQDALDDYDVLYAEAKDLAQNDQIGLEGKKKVKKIVENAFGETIRYDKKMENLPVEASDGLAESNLVGWFFTNKKEMLNQYLADLQEIKKQIEPLKESVLGIDDNKFAEQMVGIVDEANTFTFY